MGLRFISVSDIRATSGITTQFISDSDFEKLGESAEFEVERLANTSFGPKTVIEQFDVSNNNSVNRLVLSKNPVLKVRALKVGDVDVTPSFTRLDKQGGVLWLTNEAEVSSFGVGSRSVRNSIRVKYDFGLLEDSNVSTITNGEVLAGNGVNVKVVSTTGFSVNDFVEIQGMDSMQETCKIIQVVDGENIKVDNLSYSHEDGSSVVKQEVGYVPKRLMMISASMMGVARVVGQSFDELTGYSLGDLSVQKGEPYTQWREVTTQLRKEWDDLWRSFRFRPVVM